MRVHARMSITDLFPAWMRRPGVPILLGNELRPVLPIFLSTAALILLSVALTPSLPGMLVATIACAVGSAAAAGVVFGHDFTHHTLVSTLSQPVSRARIWKTRLTLCVAFTLTLGVFAAWPIGLYEMLAWRLTGSERLLGVAPAMLILLANCACATCIAPFLTLLCRSALAGTVFTLCVPFVLFYGGDYLWSLLFPGQPEDLAFAVFLLLSFTALCAAGLLGSWRLWEGFQVVDSRPISFSLWKVGSVASDRPSARRHSWWLQLAWKEVRLQWLVIVPVLGMCVTVLEFRNSQQHSLRGEWLVYATEFWALFASLVIGAVGSSEERQLGLNEAQALLPISNFKQWLVKVVTLFALTSAFAVFLPMELLKTAPGGFEISLTFLRTFPLNAAILLCCSLYISSCCRTTLKALLISLPLSGAVQVVLEVLHENDQQMLQLAGPTIRFQMEQGHMHRAFTVPPAPPVQLWTGLLAPYIFLAIVLFLLLRFACRNHFSAEHARPERARQLIWLFVAEAAGYLIRLQFYLVLSATASL